MSRWPAPESAYKGREPDATQPSADPILEPRREAMTELARLRRHELEGLSERLGALPRLPWSRIWGAVAAILLGGATGGLIAGTQLPRGEDHTLYWVVVGAVAALGLFAALATYTSHDERSDSVTAIKDELDRILARYPENAGGS